MSKYKPTEYVVDFGDCRSSAFVELNMALIEQNGAKLGEPIVRCRDCKYLDTPDWDDVLAAQYGEPPASCMRPDGNGDYMRFEVEPDGFCKWGERKEE